MASKLAKAAMMGPQQHTAGLFSDISVDGPEIGTLVVIVDRGRNLPNRKTIGKQDAYCAARLGKEAKKTETDRRGGQTPKWDQELRFVVHDALDYHQLKVSVFSEDKRTDLIGECWIPLDSILTPGGGKNDLWHTLNYKGRYAGEIRVELTFYDSRPREIKQEEITALREGQTMKSVKRRPLPADPTSTATSVSWHGPRPLPGATGNSGAKETRQESEPLPMRHDEQFDGYRYEPESHSDIGTNYQPSMQDEYEEPDFNYNGSTLSAPPTFGGLELPELPPHTPRSYRSSNPITPKYYSPANSSPTYTLPQYDRVAETRSSATRERAGSNHTQRSDAYRDMPLRSHSTDESMQLHSQEYPEHLQRHHSADEGIRYDDNYNTPPPPPRHSRGPATPQSQPTLSQYQQNNSPAPLNIRRPGSSNTASPLVREYNPQADRYGASPRDNRMPSSAPVTANHTPTMQRFNPNMDRRGSVDADYYPEYNSHSTPPNRRPQSYAPPSNTYQQETVRSGHQMSNSMDDGRGEYGHPNQDYAQRYAHREGAPISKPRAISPAARATTRKSVSPRPSMASDGPSLRGVAFSPDSFDQFNPNMGSNGSTPQMRTPERGIPRPQESPPKIETQPIIGSDGKVIDPSDHLPSDTWAPEPEKKSPRKSHQINVKYRHSPQSTPPQTQSSAPRPLPQVAPRPTSMAPSPTQPLPHHHQSYAADDNLSQSSGGGRNRLTKRPPSHLNSSPQQQQQRSSPLRENYGYNNNSPSPSYPPKQNASGPYPPPVPAKIPHGAEQEDWHGQQSQYQYPSQRQSQNQNHQYQTQYSPTRQQNHANSLSEEMSRIDLGATDNGRGRRAPMRYGAY